MNAAGLYVHVPFCLKKCPYCDFFSVTDMDRAPAILGDIPKEHRTYGDDMGPFDTLYVGGGTPSALSHRQLAGLLQSLRGLAGPVAEFTLEANPADVDPAFLDVLSQAGVDRLSLGVQSFDDGELHLLGRRHDSAVAVQAIGMIQEAGFTLGLDLIHGLPGSTPELLRNQLEQALSFGPEHLSCYALTIAGDTPFGEMASAGTLHVPDEDLSAALYLECCDVLEAAGYHHYEVSNFARDPSLRSRHNQKYWTRIPVLGLGPAAHSFDGKRRWWNHRDLTAYHRAVESGHRPLRGFEEIDGEKARLEAIALGLRTIDGVEIGVIGHRSGASQAVGRLLDEGLLTASGNRLCPTRRGFLMADGIAELLS
jgi:oxygen-independent coproporphyrinogen-3 oxidase